MKKFFLCISLIVQFLCSEAALFAQFIADPQDKLYSHITVWEQKGYIDKIPLLRPYPVNLLVTILSAVVEKGDTIEKEIAQAYLDRLQTEITRTAPDKLLPEPFGLYIDNSFWANFDDLLYDVRPFLILQGSVCDLFSFSGLATIGFQVAKGNPSPAYTQISDDGKSGGGYASAGDLTFDGKNLGLGIIFIGSESIYFQAGINRASFGPFFDHGVVIGPQCPAAGHLSFTWAADWITVSSVLLVLNPLYVEDPDTGSKIPINSTQLPAPWTGHTHAGPVEKYLALHSYTLYPCSWWNFGIVQAVVFGGRFNPAYLFPFQHLPYTQLLFGDKDSSYLGFYSRFKLPLYLRLDFILYIDDFNFNKFIGGEGTLFDLNSAQNKVAFQAGLSFTPPSEFLKRISFDYSLITPYTYTHDSTAEVNYLNYVHEDTGIGSILQPNSDQMYLTVTLQPAAFLSIDFFTRFTRHGNASEGILPGDSSYWDDGREDDGTVTFYGPMRFLTQAVIEKIFQIGIRADLSIRLGFAILKLGAGYIFEYGWDREIISGNDGLKNYINFKLGFEF